MGSVVFNGQSVRPGKVVCVGKNYAAHIEEMASVPAENMVVFMKPATSIGTELFAALGPWQQVQPFRVLELAQ